ncbi:hypothetical protein B4077_2507 [Bacillus cereus]|uniref:DUF3885 domain-containing protein n=1 Tax=Bacillus cereus TaxID=1396 RepID=A0A0G8EQ60_BACCE|nr:hypothetical protein B4077_2507 [Bacillus cereus]
MEYFSQIYTYNKYLFEDIFSKEDEVFLVTNVYRLKKGECEKSTENKYIDDLFRKEI